jgi:hypothetical protein
MRLSEARIGTIHGSSAATLNGTRGDYMSQAEQHRAWTKGWLGTYFERGRPLEQQLTEYERVQRLPDAIKRGLCIYIQSVVVTGLLLRELFRDLGQESLWNRLLGRKFPDSVRFQIIQEMISYVLFETVKQLGEYGAEGKPREGAGETLDSVRYWLATTYDIQAKDKLQEYQQAGNPVEHVARNIARIAAKREPLTILNAATTVS